MKTVVQETEDSAAEEVRNKLRKTAAETWKQYIQRLEDQGSIPPVRAKEWRAGKPFDMILSTYEKKKRSKEVEVAKMKEVNGKLVEVTELETQFFEVTIPKVVTLQVPAMGTSPDDTLFPKPELLNKIVKFATMSDGLRNNDDEVNNQMNPVLKLSTETWEAYIQRLKKNELMTQEQVDNWSRGQSIRIQGPFPITRVRIAKRAKVVDGKVKTLDVNVPYTQELAKLEIPKRASLPEDAEFPLPESSNDY